MKTFGRNVPAARLICCWVNCMILVINASYPSPRNRLSRIQYENTSGEKAITEFFYDKSGSPSRAYWEMLDKSKSSVNYYEYDNSDNLISVFRVFSNGVESFELFTYDSLGNKIAEFFYRSDTLSGQARYEYKNGNLIKARCDNYKGWLTGEIFYTLDSSGRPVSAFIERNGQNEGSISYKYDSMGNLILEAWFMYGWWTQTFNYLYESVSCDAFIIMDPLVANPCNHRIILMNYNQNFRTGGITTYYYNNKGLLWRTLFRGTGDDTAQFELVYDKTMRVAGLKRIGKSEIPEIFRYTYDHSGRVILVAAYLDGKLRGFESYTYDNFGRLIKSYFQNSREMNLTGYLSFTYDQFDRLSRGTFTGDNGVKADLVFTYGANNVLKELLWNFYSGDFQKYTFEYEKVNF